MKPEQIYFLKNATTGLIKIGCSTNPTLRMKNVKYDRKEDRTHEYRPMFTALGSFHLEAQIQESLKKYNKKGEWFALNINQIYRVASIFGLELKKP